MSDLKAQLTITSDASGVEAGVRGAKRSLADLGAGAAAAGRRASEGLAGIGDAGETASKKVDLATRQQIGSIQRLIAVTEAGDRSSRRYQELIAAQRGVNPEALKPYLDQLDAVKAKQAAATEALRATAPVLGQVGMSARATAAALRGVPAQFTDIATSLQGGQAPLTVFLQQGGQLKDMFGGIGPAARALAGYVSSLINPFTIAAALAGGLAYELYQGSEQSTALNKALALTGNAAGTTSSKFDDMARAIAASTKTGIGGARDALQALVSSGRFSGDALQSTAAAAQALSRVTGESAADVVKNFVSMSDGVAKGAEQMNRQYHFLTAQQLEYIKTLEDQGDRQRAMAVTMEALTARIGDVGQKVGFLTGLWRNAKEAASEFAEILQSIGRDQTLSEAISKAELRVRQLRHVVEGKGASNATDFLTSIFGDPKAKLADAESVVSTLQKSRALGESVAQAAAASAAREEAATAVGKLKLENLTKELKLKNALRDANALLDKANASPEDRGIVIAGIMERYKGVADEAKQLNKARLDADIGTIKAASEQLNSIYKSSESIMEALRSAGLLSDREYFESKRGFINLEIQTEDSRLSKEIARYKEEKLAGKDKIENDKKIAETQVQLAILRANGTAKLEVLSTQEEAAAKRLQLAFLTTRQAAQEYFDTISRQQQRELGGLGAGTEKRNFNAGISQIEDRYAGQRRDLENHKAQLELEGKFTSDAQAQYAQRLAIIEEFQGKSIASYTGYYAELIQKQGDWSLGAEEALHNYVDASRNYYAQAAEAFSSAFRGMEDALTQFVMTGKGNFKDLANSIIADLVRMQARAALSSLFQSIAGGIAGASTSSGSGVDYSLPTSGVRLGAPRAGGGDVFPRSLQHVNEQGPELLSSGGKDYLLMGSQGGYVTPNNKLGGGGGNNAVFNSTIAAGVQRSELNTALQKQEQVYRAMLEQRLRAVGA